MTKRAPGRAAHASRASAPWSSSMCSSTSVIRNRSDVPPRVSERRGSLAENELDARMLAPGQLDRGRGGVDAEAAVVVGERRDVAAGAAADVHDRAPAAGRDQRVDHVLEEAAARGEPPVAPLDFREEPVDLLPHERPTVAAAHPGGPRGAASERSSSAAVPSRYQTRQRPVASAASTSRQPAGTRINETPASSRMRCQPGSASITV